MSDAPAFTRRRFLQTGLVVVSTVGSVPTFLHRSAMVMAQANDGSLVASRPSSNDQRILVVVQLSGGNDGLNTVVPFGYDDYYRARPTLAVPAQQALRLEQGGDIGLHPELADLKAMFDDGLAAIVQGVGYPNPNRSHFASMDIWHTANPAGGKGLGWLGKALDHGAVDIAGNAQPTACVCIGNDAPLAAQGRTVKPITFESPSQFRWSGRELSSVLAAAYDRVHQPAAMREIPSDERQAAFVLRTAMNAQVVSDQVRQAVSQGPLTAFPAGPLANQLRMVAAMIRAGLPTRVYYVDLGGFDTHAGQTQRHSVLLRNFASALRAFYAELKALGQEQRVLTMAFSEFGRRVEQNASNGTDHGTAGPMFLAGPMVRPGLLGEHPTLSRGRLDDGDMVYTADFRSIYAAVLDEWLKINSAQVLGQAFRPARVLRPA